MFQINSLAKHPVKRFFVHVLIHRLYIYPLYFLSLFLKDPELLCRSLKIFLLWGRTQIPN